MEARPKTASKSEMGETSRAERQSENDHLLSLPFDHYQRYALTKRFVSLLWPDLNSHPLRILDVGGHYSSLKHFLPDDEVLLADVQPPPPFTYRESIPFRYDSYFLATGGKLPWADGSFHLVTAHDTLEHVRDQDRPAFLTDLLRVARHFVLVNGPMFNTDTADVETRVALFIRRALSEENMSLREHLDLGLPQRDLIESVLREQGLAFIAVPNGSLRLWLAMMAIKHYVMALPNSDWLHEVIDRTANSLLSPQDIGGAPCYREAYLIAKNPRDAKMLRRVEELLGPSFAKPPVLDAIEFPETLLAALEEHASAVRRHLANLGTAVADRDRRLASVEATLADKDRHITNLEAALADKDAALVEKDAALAQRESLLAQREASLQQATQELIATRQSLGYRILEGYRRPIRWLFPADSRRGLPYRALRRAVRWLLDRRPVRSS